MVGSVLDADIFRACKITLKINNFEILNIEVEEVGLLLVDDGEFLSDFDARVELSDLFVVNLHRIVMLLNYQDNCYSSVLHGSISRSSRKALISTEGVGFSSVFYLGGDMREIVRWRDIFVDLA